MPTKKVMRQEKTGDPDKYKTVEVEVAYSTYDIFNPLRNRRVIYDGIDNKHPIVIESGETKKNQELADVLVNRINNNNNDLRITRSKPTSAEDNSELGDPPPAQPKAAAAGARR